LCALAFIMCSKSNPIVVFALDLMSTYEGEHMIFGLLGQANLTQNDVLQFHPHQQNTRFISCTLPSWVHPSEFGKDASQLIQSIIHTCYHHYYSAQYYRCCEKKIVIMWKLYDQLHAKLKRMNKLLEQVNWKDLRQDPTTNTLLDLLYHVISLYLSIHQPMLVLEYISKWIANTAISPLICWYAYD
jgi:hypothetical protein